MRKKSIAMIAVLMVCIFAVSPLSTFAAWDRLETNTPGNLPSSSAYPYSNFKSKITEYKGVNSEVVGWLKVPNTNIDEPIVLNTGSNDYYVYRDWKGTHYSGITYQNYVDTATYLDFRTVLGSAWHSGTSKNMVLYGHNWNNLRSPFVIGNQPGYTMFAQLPSYTSMEFATANPHIYFSTGENEGIWRIFAVGYCELSPDFFYNNPNPSTENYQKLIDEWRSRSIFNINVDVDTNDRLLTLSTCTRVFGNVSEGGVGDLQRFVVVARLLREGESENQTVTMTNNANVKMPNF